MAHDEELDRLGRARDQAWEAKQSSKQSLDEAWEYLQNLQGSYGGQINSLKDEHDQLFEEQTDCFARSREAFANDDHDNAAYYSRRGHEIRDRLPDLVYERHRLIDELTEARQVHRRRVEHYRPLKAAFDNARARFDERLALVRAEDQRRRQEKQSQNALRSGQRSSWDPPGSKPPNVGIVAGTKGGSKGAVSFKTGRPGSNKEGHVLIGDGDFSQDPAGFKDSHDHSGPDSATGKPFYVERGKYTGRGGSKKRK